MKAIVLNRYGGPDEVTVADHPDPKVAPGEVLVRVKAAGVNPVDWKLAAGGLDPLMEARFPLIPGWDVAGIVEAVGLDVEEYAVGDEVIGYVRKDHAELGSYAELVSANVRLLAPKPAALDWAQAAGLPLAGLTAYQALRRLGVGAGDTVLIHAAAGGVGALGVQLAKEFGARVIGTASERNHAFLDELGAEPVSYGEGLADRLREVAPDGVDATVDFVGGEEAVDVSRQVTKDRTRVASIADPAVTEYGGRYMWVRPSAEDLTELSKLADAGKLGVHVDRTYPLAEAAVAWRVSQAGNVRGKLVLTVG
ncbi:MULTISPECIES: NADP-dependent oxidoreductase [Prauserella salsuginis group]|uniref:NADP-dependent oxidoreductase n=1 Tax=Prauserella salsuginis TaxID=387889 RepID=A0ABW6G9T3_9PSEU|nr:MULTISPECIES: NADP-dependent oxidoreductase [Prauserella salsuginis group]